MLHLIELTPAGRGAISVVRLEGPGAVARVDEHFTAAGGRPLSQRSSHAPVVGRFGPAPGEQVVVYVAPGANGVSAVPGPHLNPLPEGEGTAVEICCHGGPAAVERIAETLAAADVERLNWIDWIERREPDPIRAAAAVDLAEASTPRTAMILLDQYNGALGRAVEEIDRAAADGREDQARRFADTLLARADCGRHLVRPWQVAIAGRPNVGKSSLINALLGFRRAIVHPTPGTTRDAVGAATAVDGWPVELYDTAGLRPASRKEKAGHWRDAPGTPNCPLPLRERGRVRAAAEPLPEQTARRAQETLDAADLVVLVLDRSQPLTGDDRRLLMAYPEALVVLNKCDLPAAAAVYPSGIATSALEGAGLDELRAAISIRLVPEPPPPGAAVPFRAEQVDWLRAGWYETLQGK